MEDKIERAVERTNKNLDNALTVAVGHLRFISAMENRLCLDDPAEIVDDCIKIANDGLKTISELLKIKQKD